MDNNNSTEPEFSLGIQHGLKAAANGWSNDPMRWAHECDGVYEVYESGYALGYAFHCGADDE